MNVLLRLGTSSNGGATATFTSDVDAQTGGTTSVVAHMPAVNGGTTSVATHMPAVNDDAASVATPMFVVSAQTGGGSEAKLAAWRPWLDTPITPTTLGKE